ncbi:hypothetical protein Gotri_009712 [Gossypium trilobum]|uniref:Uncharacterized protein n=1 Tax=Gossypium trilobum TaxID=34281 RepID=A0A7J9ENA6_9ROSI|nr:hypothetical protein [Gossypium trilobum]
MFVGLLIGLIWEHFNQQELAAAAGRKGDGRSAYKVHTEEAENLVMEEKSQHRRMTPMKVEAIIDRRDSKLLRGRFAFAMIGSAGLGDWCLGFCGSG